MKPLFALILCLCLLALCACGQAVPEETSAVTTTTTATTTAAPSTTTEAPTTLSINYPASYKDAPAAYKPVLDDLYKFVQSLHRELEDGRLDLGELPFSSIPSGKLGYAVKDINNDSTPELLLLAGNYSDTEEYVICSLFTLTNGKPVHLGMGFLERCRTSIAADGTIYERVWNGAGRENLSSYLLKPGASELTRLTEYDSDGMHSLYFKGNYYHGEWEYVTEEEYNAFYEKCDTPPNPMQFNFIPIEQ